eukprot:TRINITY_DN27223_c0_g1_i1.p1 TRINITY_DN27223_c0_g1~~TRINITY_DN27223_c0_g1_i1.p1  ORF type:complete len:125 (+),score=1.35 TRINITY_DN27223_c0_g1_i1:53-427(+)
MSSLESIAFVNQHVQTHKMPTVIEWLRVNNADVVVQALQNDIASLTEYLDARAAEYERQRTRRAIESGTRAGHLPPSSNGRAPKVPTEGGKSPSSNSWWGLSPSNFGLRRQTYRGEDDSLDHRG